MANKEYKMVFMGDFGVGKSATTIQFVQNIFVKDYDPTIEDSYRKQAKIDDELCMLDILDTAGEEGFDVLRDPYIVSGEGFLFMYSITDRRSFDNVSEKYNQVIAVKDTESVPIVLMGNKCDLERERQVSKEEGEELANIMGGPFFETSAKERINIEVPFYELVREINNKRNSVCIQK